MCLDTVTAQYDPPLEEEVEAWGRFIHGAQCGGVAGPFFGPYYLLNTWVEAETGLDDIGYLRSGSGVFYRVGFHRYACMPRKYAFCEDYLHKVKLRKIVARGMDGGLEVIVAREMYVYPQEAYGAQSGKNQE